MLEPKQTIYKHYIFLFTEQSTIMFNGYHQWNKIKLKNKTKTKGDSICTYTQHIQVMIDIMVMMTVMHHHQVLQHHQVLTSILKLGCVVTGTKYTNTIHIFIHIDCSIVVFNGYYHQSIKYKQD